MNRRSAERIIARYAKAAAACSRGSRIIAQPARMLAEADNGASLRAVARWTRNEWSCPNASGGPAAKGEGRVSKRLEGKVAIIVGAGQMAGESIGTGRATALRFMQEGASVLALDRHMDSAEETLALGGAGRGDSFAFRADVTSSADLEAAVAAAMRKWGRIDVVFYNVGVAFAAGDRPLEEFTDEIFERMGAINLRGAIMTAKYAIPVMRKQKSGVFLSLSSVSAIETTRPNIGYRITKAGLIAFTQQLAIQNAEYGVRANSILPGMMDTPMAVDQRVSLLGKTREQLVAERSAQVPLRGKMGTGWDVANAALFLASDEADFITGIALPVDGGMLSRIGW